MGEPGWWDPTMAAGKAAQGVRWQGTPHASRQGGEGIPWASRLAAAGRPPGMQGRLQPGAMGQAVQSMGKVCPPTWHGILCPWTFSSHLVPLHVTLLLPQDPPIPPKGPSHRQHLPLMCLPQSRLASRGRWWCWCGADKQHVAELGISRDWHRQRDGKRHCWNSGDQPQGWQWLSLSLVPKAVAAESRGMALPRGSVGQDLAKSYKLAMAQQLQPCRAGVVGEQPV